jgi:hypothetical protein
MNMNKLENKNKAQKKDEFSDFRKVLQEESNVPKQKVVPIKKDIREGKKLFTVLLPEKNIKELKMLSIKLDLSLKEMVNEAIIEYWIKKNK